MGVSLLALSLPPLSTRIPNAGSRLSAKIPDSQQIAKALFLLLALPKKRPPSAPLGASPPAPLTALGIRLYCRHPNYPSNTMKHYRYIMPLLALCGSSANGEDMTYDTSISINTDAGVQYDNIYIKGDGTVVTKTNANWGLYINNLLSIEVGASLVCAEHFVAGSTANSGMLVGNGGRIQNTSAITWMGYGAKITGTEDGALASGGRLSIGGSSGGSISNFTLQNDAQLRIYGNETHAVNMSNLVFDISSYSNQVSSSDASYTLDLSSRFMYEYMGTSSESNKQLLLAGQLTIQLDDDVFADIRDNANDFSLIIGPTGAERVVSELLLQDGFKVNIVNSAGQSLGNFDGSSNNGFTLTWSNNAIPEPSTATLSLLALAALTTRRKRNLS